VISVPTTKLRLPLPFPPLLSVCLNGIHGSCENNTIIVSLLAKDFFPLNLPARGISTHLKSDNSSLQATIQMTGSNSKTLVLFLNLQSIFFPIIFAASSLLNHSASDAQGIIATSGVCACTPSIYEFMLDVLHGCPSAEAVDLILELGIESAECAVVPTTTDDSKNLVPVSVHTITVEEFKQDNTIAVSQSIQGAFQDGDAFRYISISSDLEDIEGAVDLPRTLQFKISGKNQDGKDILNTIVIEFTNDCEVYPVIQRDHTAGWIRFVSWLRNRYANKYENDPRSSCIM
jgi:hypothetical protein